LNFGRVGNSTLLLKLYGQGSGQIKSVSSYIMCPATY
jgi:hypothetical protein